MSLLKKNVFKINLTTLKGSQCHFTPISPILKIYYLYTRFPPTQPPIARSMTDNSYQQSYLCRCESFRGQKIYLLAKRCPSATERLVLHHHKYSLSLSISKLPRTLLLLEPSETVKRTATQLPVHDFFAFLFLLLHFYVMPKEEPFLQARFCVVLLSLTASPQCRVSTDIVLCYNSFFLLLSWYQFQTVIFDFLFRFSVSFLV